MFDIFKPKRLNQSFAQTFRSPYNVSGYQINILFSHFIIHNLSSLHMLLPLPPRHQMPPLALPVTEISSSLLRQPFRLESRRILLVIRARAFVLSVVLLLMFPYYSSFCSCKRAGTWQITSLRFRLLSGHKLTLPINRIKATTKSVAPYAGC